MRSLINLGTGVLSLVVFGLPTSLEAALGQAAAKHLVSGTVSGVMEHGKLDRAIGQSLKGEGLKNLATSLGTTALTYGITQELGVKNPSEAAAKDMATQGIGQGVGQGVASASLPSFTNHLEYQLQTQLIGGFSQGASQLVVEGKITAPSIAGLISQGITGAAVATLGNRIGVAYGKNELDPISHKLIHGALGFTSGAVVGSLTGKDALMQATSGALGAVVAETLNDIHQAEIEAGVNTGLTDASTNNIGLNDQQFHSFLHKLQEHHQFHTLVGGLTALGFGLDPTQAMVSAQVAQESNNLLAAAYGVAVGGVVLYNLAHKANLLYEGEFEEFLTEVGIEIALVRATAGLGNLAKAASKTATGQQLLAAAKPYVYKVIIQGKAFMASSADQVLQLIAKQQPQLATVLNKQASSFSHFLQADVKAGVKVGGGGVKGIGVAQKPKVKGVGVKADATAREKLFGTNDVAKSSGGMVRKINNRMPINHEYAGKVYHFENLPANIKAKYPNLQRDYQHGIPFTPSGNADFSRYAKYKVEILFSGNSKLDISNANKMKGYKQTPKGQVWHHHHDGKTMLLLPQDIHDAFRHTGGDAIIRGITK